MKDGIHGKWNTEHMEQVSQICSDFKPKQTNADRIRAMSDEELAEFLEKVISGKREVIGIKCGNEKCESWKCTECIQTWLQSEAE